MVSVLAGGVLAGCSAGDLGMGEPPSSERITRVVDGDTVVLSRSGRTRLIGIDTPEVFGGAECFGRAASAFAKRRFTGRRVRVERDVEERDRYGRLLAYLYADGRMVNATLVREGYATQLTVPPNVEHADTFRRLAREAREAGRGLWSACSTG